MVASHILAKMTKMTKMGYALNAKIKVKRWKTDIFVKVAPAASAEMQKVEPSVVSMLLQFFPCSNL